MLGYILMSNLVFVTSAGDVVSSTQRQNIHELVPTRQDYSSVYLNVVRRWLDWCERDHPHCRNQFPELPLLPERIVYISQSGEDVHLQRGVGRRARYATLSYCWGGYITIKTTTDNLQRHMVSLSASDLPRTFRDAIAVCKHLAISYLWIDSLCILQDSKTDWEIQSAMMDTIYHNSTVTLAAAGASDPSQGLFIPSRLGHDIFPLPCAVGDDKVQGYLLQHDEFISTVDFLQNRGWCTQELQLSRRLICFYNGDLLWQCIECRRTRNSGWLNAGFQGSLRIQLNLLKESFARPYQLVFRSEQHERSYSPDTITQNDGRHRSGPLETFNDKASILVDFREPSMQDSMPPQTITQSMNGPLHQFLDQCARFGLYYFWYMFIEEYSQCHLTEPADKLPALAGIASRIHSITKDNYLAGHWRRELPRSLFWQYKRWFVSLRRVVPYRAPSWSWASVDGRGVTWRIPDLFLGDEQAAPIRIIATDIEIDGQNPFGRVLAGSITMRAPTISASWNQSKQGWVTKCPSRPTEVHKLAFSDTLALYDLNGGERIGWWFYDDVMNGILPGEHLTSESSQKEVLARQIRREGSTNWNTLWKRGTYVPSEVLLVKGTYWKHVESIDQVFYGTAGRHTVLVLARLDEGHAHLELPSTSSTATSGAGDARSGRFEGGEISHEEIAERPVQYRRVGIGEVWAWNDEVERIETLTIV
jgi:hypothetical protein